MGADRDDDDHAELTRVEDIDYGDGEDGAADERCVSRDSACLRRPQDGASGEAADAVHSGAGSAG